MAHKPFLGIYWDDWTRFDYHKQVFTAFGLLVFFGAVGVVYVTLNKTPSTIEKRTDSEAGF